LNGGFYFYNLVSTIIKMLANIYQILNDAQAHP